MFGVDFENDPGKLLVWGNVNLTSPTDLVWFDILRLCISWKFTYLLCFKKILKNFDNENAE